MAAFEEPTPFEDVVSHAFPAGQAQPAYRLALAHIVVMLVSTYLPSPQ